MEAFKKLKKKILSRCRSTKANNQASILNPRILARCKSFPPWRPSNPASRTLSSLSRGKGCFAVYVGPERQRFVMKAKYANHPLFKMLLDDAGEQYGYRCEGPLILPCDVNMFIKVLAEMDYESTDNISPRCCARYGSYNLLTPSRFLKLNQF